MDCFNSLACTVPHKTGNIAKAREYFHWSVKCATGLDFLPEQVDKMMGNHVGSYL